MTEPVKENVTIEVYRHTDKAITTISMNVRETLFQYYGPHILKATVEGLMKRLEQEWYDRYGAELLEQMAPGVIGATIRTKLEAEIAKKVLG